MKHIVDLLKQGEGKEKVVYIEVDGKQIGTICLGRPVAGSPTDPKRVIVAFRWKDYELEKVEHSPDIFTAITLAPKWR